MKNVLRVTALGAALAAALYAPASATSARSGDVQGPACADITNGGVVSSNFNPSTGTTTTFTFVINTANPSCTDVTYTVYVHASAAGGVPIQSVSVQGTRFADPIEGPELFVTLTGSYGSHVCLSADSSGKDGQTSHVYDRAPDADGSCVDFDLTTGGSAFGNFT